MEKIIGRRRQDWETVKEFLVLKKVVTILETLINDFLSMKKRKNPQIELELKRKVVYAPV